MTQEDVDRIKNQEMLNKMREQNTVAPKAQLASEPVADLASEEEKNEEQGQEVSTEGQDSKTEETTSAE